MFYNCVHCFPYSAFVSKKKLNYAFFSTFTVYDIFQSCFILEFTAMLWLTLSNRYLMKKQIADMNTICTITFLWRYYKVQFLYCLFAAILEYDPVYIIIKLFIFSPKTGIEVAWWSLFTTAFKVIFTALCMSVP